MGPAPAFARGTGFLRFCFFSFQERKLLSKRIGAQGKCICCLSVNKVVLAYSGGLDTSIILKWLVETYKCEVVAFSADLGWRRVGRPQAKPGYGAVKAASRPQEEFARDFIFRPSGECHLRGSLSSAPPLPGRSLPSSRSRSRGRRGRYREPRGHRQKRPGAL